MALTFQTPGLTIFFILLNFKKTDCRGYHLVCECGWLPELEAGGQLLPWISWLQAV